MMASASSHEPNPLALRTHNLGALYQWIQDSLQMVVALGEIQGSVHNEQGPEPVFRFTREQLSRFMRFDTTAFYLVRDTDYDFVLADCDPPFQRAKIEQELAAQIDLGTFAWAMNQNRAVMVPAKFLRRTLVLHVLTTRSRIVGMFLGAMIGDERRMTDIAQTQLSILMFNCAYTLENATLYEKIRNQSRELNATVAQRTKDLNRALESAKAASRTKSEFLANMSHEIRTPMNTILGFAQLLEGTVSTPEQKEYLRVIASSGKNLLMLINDILDLSKIEAGRMEIQQVPVNLTQVLHEIAGIYQYLANEKNLTLTVDLDDSLPSVYLLDEIRLRQILINLVGNAIKFTSQGSIRIGLKGKASSKENSSFDLLLEVADTGKGIPPDQLERIFDAFVQQAGQDNRQHAGTGLGLAITRRLVQLMGGAVKVSSTVGKGSVFSVELRGIPVAATGEQPSGEVSKPSGQIRFQPATVLLAEDVSLNRKLVIEFLKGSGVEVVEARNGAEALNLAREIKPAAIIMDLRMPVMDGYETTQQIKADKRLHSLPVIALTAGGQAEVRERALASGCDAFLLKPVEKDHLLTVLAQFLPTVSDDEAPQAGPTTESGAENRAGVALSPAQREKISQIVKELETEYMQRWEQLRQHMVIDEINSFGEAVAILGRETQLAGLKDWGTALGRYASRYQIEELAKSLAHYPQLVEQIRQDLDQAMADAESLKVT